MKGISWLAEDLPAFPGLYSIQSVISQY